MNEAVLQRYKLTIIRQGNGDWVVCGYWEINVKSFESEWDLDGAPMGFKNLQDALGFISRQKGIPE